MKLLIPLLISSLVFLTSCEKQESAPLKKHYKTYSTATGSITIQDSLIATVEWNKTSVLGFRAGGIIADIYVQPGDRVKKWQLLARLGNRESSLQISWLSNIEREMQNLSQSTNFIWLGSQNAEKATEKLYDEQIKGIELNIKQLENTISQAEQNLQNQTSWLKDTYITFVQDFDRISTAMLYEGDKILGITSSYEYQDDAWEDYVGARVGTSRADAINKWNALYSLRWDIRKYMQSWATLDDMNTTLQALRNAYIGSRTFGKSMSYMLQNSVIGKELPEEKLLGWTNIWKWLEGENQVSETNFTSWKNSTLNITSTSNSTGSVEDKNINTLKIELLGLKQTKQSTLAEKESKIREIRINTAAIEGKKDEVGLKLAEVGLSRALAVESSAYSVITAPFDGVILEKYLDEGMVISVGSPLLKITNTESTLAKVYIDNALYLYKKWDILFGSTKDANESFSGTLSLMQEQKDPLYNKNYAEINISHEITIGEKIEIQLKRNKSSLQNGTLIPLSSIISRYGPPWVFVVQDGKSKFQLIEILGSDMSHAEVLGIPEGAQIITEGKENIYDGEVLN